MKNRIYKNMKKVIITALFFTLLAVPAFATMQGTGAGNMSTRDEFSCASDVNLDARTPSPIGSSYTKETDTTGGAATVQCVSASGAISPSADVADDQLIYSMSPVPANADYGFNWTIKTADTGSANFMYGGCRNEEGTENGYWYGGVGGSASLVLGKNVSGTWTLLDADELNHTLADGDVLEIRCVGSKIFGYANGELSVYANDSSITAIGKSAIGFGDLDTTTDDIGTDWVLDDFQVHLVGDDPVPPFSPNDISSLILRLEAESRNLSLTGVDVDQLNDRSGQGNHVSESTASNKPHWDSVNEEIDFTSADSQNLSVANFSGGAATQPTTIITLVRVNTAANGVILDSGACDADRQQFAIKTDNTTTMFAGTVVVDGTYTTGTYAIHSMVFDGANSESWLNGVSNGVLSATPGANSLDGLHIGTGCNGVSFAVDISYKGSWVFDGALSTADHNSMGNYIVDKFSKPSTPLSWTTIP